MCGILLLCTLAVSNEWSLPSPVKWRKQFHVSSPFIQWFSFLSSFLCPSPRYIPCSFLTLHSCSYLSILLSQNGHFEWHCISECLNTVILQSVPKWFQFESRCCKNVNIVAADSKCNATVDLFNAKFIKQMKCSLLQSSATIHLTVKIFGQK